MVEHSPAREYRIEITRHDSESLITWLDGFDATIYCPDGHVEDRFAFTRRGAFKVARRYVESREPVGELHVEARGD